MGSVTTSVIASFVIFLVVVIFIIFFISVKKTKLKESKEETDVYIQSENSKSSIKPVSTTPVSISPSGTVIGTTPVSPSGTVIGTTPISPSGTVIGTTPIIPGPSNKELPHKYITNLRAPRTIDKEFVGTLASQVDLMRGYILIDPLHPDIPFRHNVQKTCNVKFVAGTIIQNIRNYSVKVTSDVKSFKIEHKIAIESDFEYIGWPLYYPTVDRPLKQEFEVFDEAPFDGGYDVYSQQVYLNRGDKGCFEGGAETRKLVEVSMVNINTKCSEFTNDYVTYFNIPGDCSIGSCSIGSVVISWMANGNTPKRVGSCELLHSSGSIITLPVFLKAYGNMYSEFSIKKSDDQIIDHYLKSISSDSTHRYGMKETFKLHYRLNHDIMCKGGSLLDIIEYDSMNVVVVFRDFEIDIKYVEIGLTITILISALNSSGLKFSSVYNDVLEIANDDIQNYIIDKLYDEEGALKFSMDVTKVKLLEMVQFKDTEYMKLCMEVAFQRLLNNDSKATENMKQGAGMLVNTVVMFHQIQYHLDGFRNSTFIRGEYFRPGGTFQSSVNYIIKYIYDSIFSDDFVKYCVAVIEKSVNNWKNVIDTDSQIMKTNLSKVLYHKRHEPYIPSSWLNDKTGKYIKTDDQKHTLNNDPILKDCSWSSPNAYVFKDILSFPSVNPNKSHDLCKDDVWHLGLSIMPHPTAAALSPEILYSHTKLLEEYLDFKSDGNLYDVTMTHEMGHLFSFHDVYEYDSRFPDFQEVSTNSTIMYNNDVLTDVDKALANLAFDIRYGS